MGIFKFFSELDRQITEKSIDRAANKERTCLNCEIAYHLSEHSDALEKMAELYRRNHFFSFSELESIINNTAKKNMQHKGDKLFVVDGMGILDTIFSWRAITFCPDCAQVDWDEAARAAREEQEGYKDE